MDSFYQSPLWITINQQCYQKSHFSCTIAWQTYIWRTKWKRLMGKQFQRYMIHGVEIPSLTEQHIERQQSLAQLKRDYGRGFGDLFFQLGISTTFDTRLTWEVKQNKVRTEILAKRQEIYQHLWAWYDVMPSRREHMPQATIVLNLQKSPDDWFKDLSDSGKRYLNKGKKAQLSFVEATESDRLAFWQVRYTTAYDKGFAVVPQEQFLRLRDFLLAEKKWTLFLLKQGQDIVSWSVCLFRNKTLIYLYGATARAFGDIGAHYLLNREIMHYASKQWFHLYDLLWVAPVGEEETHSLGGVTRFKQSFGGTTISSVGNMDLILNPLIYKAYKLRKHK